MADEPVNPVLQLLREMRGEMTDMRSEMHGIRDDLRADIHSLRADVASDLHTLDAKLGVVRKDLSDQIVGLRRAVVNYHTASSATALSSAISKPPTARGAISRSAAAR